MEDKRQIEGSKTLSKVQDMIKSTLNPGLKSSEELLVRIGESHTLKAITLTITTRSIGFGLELHCSLVPPH